MNILLILYFILVWIMIAKGVDMGRIDTRKFGWIHSTTMILGIIIFGPLILLIELIKVIVKAV